ncbi:MAG: TolC family protein [Candidatus Hydrogenedentes bacterium]|nr:TolC family protein [Candidatus Hydrogenedentota bacterium]
MMFVRNTWSAGIAGTLCMLFAIAADSQESFSLTGDVTLAQCIAHALTHSPRMEAFAADVRAAEAAQLQAKARPNPYLSLEVEDVRWQGGPGTTTTSSSFDRTPGSLSIDTSGGQGNTSITGTRPARAIAYGRAHEDGPHSGFAESDFTLRISQVVELGGKRAKRIALADREHAAAAWDYERARADLCAEVAQAFTGVLVAQRRIELSQEAVRLAQETQRAVDARVDAGKVSPIEADKARIPVAQANTEADSAREGLEAARAQLAGVCGESATAFGDAVGNLDELSEPADLNRMLDAIEKNPDPARWTAEMDVKDATIESERAKAKPDLTLTLGVRITPLASRHERDWSFNSDGVFSANRSNIDPDRDFDTRLVFEVGLPLPIFDRNKGNIGQAEALATKSRALAKDAQLRTRADLTKAFHEVSSAYVSAQRISTEIMPAAKEAFERTQIGYREGKFTYTDLVDAERTLFDARRDYLDAVRAYHDANIALERLSGGSVPESAPATPIDLSPSGDNHEPK